MTQPGYGSNERIAGYLNGLAWDPEMDLWYYTSPNPDAQTVASMITAAKDDIARSQGASRLELMDYSLEPLGRLSLFSTMLQPVLEKELESFSGCSQAVHHQIEAAYTLMASESVRVSRTADLIVAEISETQIRPTLEV